VGSTCYYLEQKTSDTRAKFPDGGWTFQKFSAFKKKSSFLGKNHVFVLYLSIAQGARHKLIPETVGRGLI
jgi:hypothetical protein